MLRAGVMEDGSVRRPVTGTPQGGVVSPLMANIYLHRVDRSWDVRRHGVLVRYADDLVVMCRPGNRPRLRWRSDGSCWPESGWNRRRRRPASCTWRWAGRVLISSASTTGWCEVRVDAGRRRHLPGPLASKKAMQHARDRVRELTDRSRLLLPVDGDEDVNRFLRGWAAYFRYGNSADQFDKINGYARMRLAWSSPTGTAAPGFGWYVLDHARDQLGLVDLTGTVAAPRPFRAWRERPNAGGERRR